MNAQFGVATSICAGEAKSALKDTGSLSDEDLVAGYLRLLEDFAGFALEHRFELIEIELGLGQISGLERIRAVLEKLDVPVTLPENMDKNILLDLVKRDKKAVNQWPKFILIEKIGSVHRQKGQWAVDVEQGIIEKIIEKL